MSAVAQTDERQRLVTLACGSIVVALFVLAIKALAYRMSGSVALYSDALESVINVATGVAALVAIRVSGQPADANHPFGHDKAEYLSAVMEGVLIFGAALFILREAYFGFLSPHPIDAPFRALGVTTIGTAINAGWGYVLMREGRKRRSLALVADGRHLYADVVTSIGVIVGVGLVVMTDIMVLDSAIAGLVALHVLWSGWSMTRESVGGLMDAAVEPNTLAKIKQIIGTGGDGAIEAHDLRTRQAGRVTFIDFHLVVPGAMSVCDAHEICDRWSATSAPKSKARRSPFTSSLRTRPNIPASSCFEP